MLDLLDSSALKILTTRRWLRSGLNIKCIQALDPAGLAFLAMEALAETNKAKLIPTNQERGRSSEPLQCIAICVKSVVKSIILFWGELCFAVVNPGWDAGIYPSSVRCYRLIKSQLERAPPRASAPCNVHTVANTVCSVYMCVHKLHWGPGNNIGRWPRIASIPQRDQHCWCWW